MRRDRVQEREGYVAVAIVIAGLDQDREFERATAFRVRLGGSRAIRHAGDRGNSSSQGYCDPAP